MDVAAPTTDHRRELVGEGDQERYKMFFRCGVPKDLETRRQLIEAFVQKRPDDVYAPGGNFDHLSGMWGATSPDGVRWTALAGPLVLTPPRAKAARAAEARGPECR